MLATWLTLCMVGVRPGEVVSIPRGTALVAADRFAWVLRDERPFKAQAGTRAIVVTVAPGGFAGVVEVRLFDATRRVCWLESAGLIPVSPRSTEPVEVDSRSQARRTSRDRPSVTQVRRQRKGANQRDLMAIEGVIAALLASAASLPDTSFPGHPFYHPVVFNTPVFQTPVFNIAIFEPPLALLPPVFDTPTF